MDRLATIAEKLAAVKAAGKTGFGAETHHFELTPPVDVSAFERARKLKLPEGYRRFVTELGGSGAGPFYGLLPLARWRDGARKKLGFAALTLTDQGCNNWSLLVLDGAKRGRVVYLNDLGTLYWPQDRDFLAWYERWLDELLWGYDSAWFGVGLAGQEPDFYRALTSKSAAKRAEGAAAMTRLPAISRRSLKALVEALRSGPPAVQLAALPAVGKHERAALDAMLPALITSTHQPLVVAALRETKGTSLGNGLATSSDVEVARTAIHSGTLSESELAALLDGPAWEPAMVALRDQREGSATARILQDIDHADVRRRQAALVCLRIRKDAAARDALRARFPLEPEPRLRAEIVEGLGAMGDIDSVIAATWSAEGLLRFRAAWALGSTPDPRAVAALTALLADEEKPPGCAFSIAAQAQKALERLASRS